jgi:hypothetical protein
MSAVFSYADNDPSTDRQIAQLRIPPHSIEAESSVLGGLLLDNGAWDRMGDVVVDSDFYRHEHKLIYAAIGTLVNASKPADVITVYEQLQNLGKADEIGGLGYLNSLAQYVPSASNIRRYAEIVRERSILRKLVSASDEIATNAFNTQGKAVDKILDEAEQKIFNIGEEGSRMKQGFQGMDSLVVELLDRVLRQNVDHSRSQPAVGDHGDLFLPGLSVELLLLEHDLGVSAKVGEMDAGLHGELRQLEVEIVGDGAHHGIGLAHQRQNRFLVAHIQRCEDQTLARIGGEELREVAGVEIGQPHNLHIGILQKIICTRGALKSRAKY